MLIVHPRQSFVTERIQKTQSSLLLWV